MFKKFVKEYQNDDNIDLMLVALIGVMACGICEFLMIEGGNMIGGVIFALACIAMLAIVSIEILIIADDFIDWYTEQKYNI